MDDVLRAHLHDLTLDARHLLVKEARELLQGVYGLSGSGTLLPASTLPAVQALEEARETYAMLERHLEDERSAGLSGAEAMDKLVREVAFTHLNRLVAFKMMESRKLLRGTLDKYHESNAFKFYLAEHPEDLARYESGTLPQDAIGEGPRDTAYRHFLLAQCAEMAKQIRVLFDPDNLASRLFPRARALGELIAVLNAPDMAPAWEQDETIGWVYQNFNAEELEAAFREARLSKRKFEAADIPSVTQLFTPRWVVKYLVQNTLGRLWLQMHPDSAVRASLDYLVPLSDAPAEALRLVREITVLDPACGTMHFGLVAFDLLAEMYREETAHAGEPGWPATPSVGAESDIPAAIVANNLFGIDIDLRAVQLSAFTLLLKARTLNPKAMLTDHNLACADIQLPGQDRYDAFVKQSLQGRPFDQNLMRTAWASLQDAAQLGSLLRLDIEVREMIAEERRKFKQLTLPGFEPQGYEAEVGEQTFWDTAEERLLSAFAEFARSSAEAGRDERYFTAEATKGIRMLGLMTRRYDVVVTNPPYMSTRKMNGQLKALLARDYPLGKGDLYAAFILRCLDFAAEQGRVGMLTMHSFMFISSYEGLRSVVRQRAAIEGALHFGPALFAVGNPGTLQTAAYVFRREPATVVRDDTAGTYLRLIKEPDALAKQLRFEHALARLALGEADAVIYRYRQGDFDAIEGAPWVYWITPTLRIIFSNKQLGDVSPPRQGLATADNFRFLRYWWEIGISHSVRGCKSSGDALLTGMRWFPYMKGGKSRKWWANQDTTVNWYNDGMEIRCLGVETGKISSRPQNTDFYFRRGITWSEITSGQFGVRLSPGGFIFDVKGSSAFPDDVHYILGLLNSSFVYYCLCLLNPTISFQVGDLARVPVPQGHSDTLRAGVSNAIDLCCQQASEQEATYDFIAPPAWPGGIQAATARAARLAAIEQEVDEDVYGLYGISQADRAAIEAELGTVSTLVELNVGEESAVGAESAEDIADEDADTGGVLNRQQLAQRWVSYAIGIVLGRFQPGVDGAIGRGDVSSQTALALAAAVAGDGISMVDGTQPDHLISRIAQVLELLLGPAQAEQVLAEATGGNVLGAYLAYLTRDFYKWHLQQYRKRPVYWLLQSPKRSYSLFVFHERLTRDSLYRILGPDYLGGAINSAQSRTDELRPALHAMPQGRERKRLYAALADAVARLHDLEQFRRLITEVTTATNERGEVVGWQPEIDDGVLINMAPLHTLIPAWSAEPKKAWAALQRG